MGLRVLHESTSSSVIFTIVTIATHAGHSDGVSVAIISWIWFWLFRSLVMNVSENIDEIPVFFSVKFGKDTDFLTL